MRRRIDMTDLETLDAFDNQRSLPVISQKPEILPGAINSGIRFLHPFNAKEDGFFRFRVSLFERFIQLVEFVRERNLGLGEWLLVVSGHENRV